MNFGRLHATVSAKVQILVSSFPATPVSTLQLLVRLPRALTTLSYIPAVSVALMLGTSANATLGSTSASACPEGFVQGPSSSVPSAKLCIPCPGGSSAALGASSCSTCPTGSYASSPASSSCAPCPAGHGCPAGTTLPAPCAEGTYQPQTSQERCVQCPQGSFQPATAQVSCVTCPAGTGTQLQGAASAPEGSSRSRRPSVRSRWRRSGPVAGSGFPRPQPRGCFHQ